MQTSSIVSETTNLFKMPSSTRTLLLLLLNLAVVLGTTLPSHPWIQQLATRMDLIGVINGKLIAGDISQAVQQTTAQAYCQSNNGTVVIIESGLENDLIRDYMLKKNVNYFWTDLSDYGHEGTWEWASSGQVLGPSNYANWGTGEPVADKLKNCAYIDASSVTANGVWKSLECTRSGGDSSYTVRPLCQLLFKELRSPNRDEE